MSDSKHFKYDGNAYLKNGKQKIEKDQTIKSIEFLTPAKIVINSNGEESIIMVNIDIINRKVYDNKGNLFMSDDVFSHLDSIHSLPDDFYSASEELHEKVASLDYDNLMTRKN